MSLIRVLEIPPPTGNFHFGGGEVQTFTEVDWFRDEPGMTRSAPAMDSVRGREEIAEFIKGKDYFNPDKAYLVLHQEHSFTIGYSAP